MDGMVDGPDGGDGPAEDDYIGRVIQAFLDVSENCNGQVNNDDLYGLIEPGQTNPYLTDAYYRASPTTSRRS
jgi:hypothetical protein